MLAAIVVSCSPSAQPPPSPPPATTATTAPTASATTEPTAVAPTPSASSDVEDPPTTGDSPTPHPPDVLAGASIKVPPPPPPPPADGSCPSTFSALKDGKCKCKPGAPSGNVWGTTIYTNDSSICGAAIHVGAIKADKGGEVTVKAAPGCGAYSASNQNGVKSSSWAAWNGSFYFPGFGDGKCPVIKGNTCAETFASSKPGPDGQLTCQCGANAAGTIYGTGVYTADSSICAAAVHAGAIPAKAGGKVTAKSLPGCSKYLGTTNNGITSVKWGSYGASFFFPGFGIAKCP